MRRLLFLPLLILAACSDVKQPTVPVVPPMSGQPQFSSSGDEKVAAFQNDTARVEFRVRGPDRAPRELSILVNGDEKLNITFRDRQHGRIKVKQHGRVLREQEVAGGGDARVNIDEDGPGCWQAWFAVYGQSFALALAIQAQNQTAIIQAGMSLISAFQSVLSNCPSVWIPLGNVVWLEIQLAIMRIQFMLSNIYNGNYGY